MRRLLCTVSSANCAMFFDMARAAGDAGEMRGEGVTQMRLEPVSISAGSNTVKEEG